MLLATCLLLRSRLSRCPMLRGTLMARSERAKKMTLSSLLSPFIFYAICYLLIPGGIWPPHATIVDECTSTEGRKYLSSNVTPYHLSKCRRESGLEGWVQKGYLTKDDLESALHAHKKSRDELRSDVSNKAKTLLHIPTKLPFSRAERGRLSSSVKHQYIKIKIAFISFSTFQTTIYAL